MVIETSFTELPDVNARPKIQFRFSSQVTYGEGLERLQYFNNQCLYNDLLPKLNIIKMTRKSVAIIDVSWLLIILISMSNRNFKLTKIPSKAFINTVIAQYGENQCHH